MAKLKTRVRNDILNTPGKRLAAWILSILVPICLALLVVFFSVGKNDVKPAAAEQKASPSATASATPAVTATPKPKPSEEQKTSDNGVGPQIDTDRQTPALQRKAPERAGAEAPPVVKPQIPPKPVGIAGRGRSGGTPGVIPGKYVLFGSNGWWHMTDRSGRDTGGRYTGRSEILDFSDMMLVDFVGTLYTPEQVAILDQYYGGVG